MFLDVVEEGKFKTWIEDLEPTGLLILESGSLRITSMLFLMIYESVLQDKTPDKLENIDNGVITLLCCCGSYDQIHGISLLYESLMAQLLPQCKGRVDRRRRIVNRGSDVMNANHAGRR